MCTGASSSLLMWNMEAAAVFAFFELFSSLSSNNSKLNLIVEGYVEY